MINKILKHALTLSIILSANTIIADEINVYLIGGQSNAAGRARTSNVISDPGNYGSSAADLTNPDVMLWHSSTLAAGPGANSWTTLAPAPQFGGGYFGPEIGLGNRLAELNPTRKIAIIKHAKGATSLHTDWDADRTPGLQFTTFLNTVNAAMQALVAQGHTPIIRGMAWQQGETDASRNNSSQSRAKAYSRKLKELILNTRSELNAPEMEFAYGSILQLLTSFPYENLVRAGQEAVDEDSGLPYSTPGANFIIADDLTTNYNNDAIHEDYIGQLELGKRFANQFGVIPEPTSIALLTVGLLALTKRHNK